MSRSTRDIGGRLKKTGVTEIKITGNYTRADIERIAQRDSNTLQRYGANARIEVVLDYGNHQFRSGKFTKGKAGGCDIKDDLATIKRVHTDGFVSTIPWTVNTDKKSLDPKLDYDNRQEWQQQQQQKDIHTVGCSKLSCSSLRYCSKRWC
ncbi:hypothetical protein SAMD00019534_084360 [Acytostelium subglobosum LB1]|uniref:hypothetical protein n=1 Tax=Acytostelium subglobosum LB1 TaxID=1410327 RepID=UPI000644CCB0|nr:hypothetical protein SAMD00019534_084360 [Acytostelium subglobosum LB1]GAM25261.1 hypothetical protein SAMD00019534_084360 [Acytostelium subglobosum LB1]|eukprot:XP_012751781.1 hypothetical protein SAMD00019534_084360 [Acytostelium subglobosum LB1]